MNQAARIGCAAVFVGLTTFLSGEAANFWVLKQDKKVVDLQLARIAEIYLDGVAATVRPGLERDLPGDVNRRLQYVLTEQTGIAERAIVIFDGTGSIQYQAGNKAVARDPRMKLTSGTVNIVHDEKTMFVSRLLKASQYQVGAALDIEAVLNEATRGRYHSMFASLLAALLAMVATSAAIFLGEGRAAARPRQRDENSDPGQVPPAG